MPGDYGKIKDVAASILQLARNTLIVNLRFMDKAISMLSCRETDGLNGYAVDGKILYYDPFFVVRNFSREKNSAARTYLHLVMHCVFRHLWTGTLTDRKYWDLACNIAVENAINDIDIPSVETGRVREQRDAVNRLKRKVRYITADSLYRYFMDKQPKVREIRRLAELFSADIHDGWYPSNERAGTEASTKQGSRRTTENGEGGAGAIGSGEEYERMLSEWKNTASHMSLELELFVRSKGDRSGGLFQNLKEVTREKYDYTAFLRKFSVLGEKMRLNDDEFDYIYYTYGLSLYKNIPLIEPLEYKEVKQIREFVIAVDTSGSTSGDLVQCFLQKTYNILKSQESFASRLNLHIIQCDADIQEDVKITGQAEFDRYIGSMKIKGLGGTDFRPVFSYVDALIARREFTNLKGMIYFTDGFGTFPSRQPDYKAAFVYVEDGYENPDVPPWAIKLVLRPDEIMEWRDEY